jgi:cysteine desulfurase
VNAGPRSLDDRPIYLDYQATTPIDPRAVEAMLPYLTREFGNPSSSHAYGRAARAAVEHARDQTAALIGADPSEIVFTSSGTESNHLALTGAAQARQAGSGDHIVVSAIEHPATQATCDRLANNGFRASRVPVESDGRVDPTEVASACGPGTILVSVMLANNEIGTVQPLQQIAAFTRERGILLHTDAAQAAASIGIDVDDLGVDLLTLVGHKMYAPKGIAALYIRGGTSLQPQLIGGGQERGLRAATENVAAIVAFGAAAEIARTEHASDAARIRALRDQLLNELSSGIPGLTVNGSLVHRLPGNLSLVVPCITAAELMAATPGLAFSAGSACHTGVATPSPVLTALGLTPEQAARTIRIGIGRYTTASDITTAAAQLTAAVPYA